MHIRALPPAFSKVVWPASMAAGIYLGPKMTKIAISALRIGSDILGGQRFFTAALPDNLYFVVSCLSPSFAPQLNKALTINAHLAIITRFIAYTILGCWLSDQTRRCVSCLSSRYLFLPEPSDEMGPNKQKTALAIKQKEKRKMIPPPVGLSCEIEQKIESLCREFNDPKIRSFYQITPLCGILLHGPTGTGKTSLARHLASRLECRADHYQYISAPSLLGRYVGQSEANVRKIFDDVYRDAKQRINQKEPIVIVIDEIDSILSSRAHCDNFQLGMGTSLVNQFLISMDQIKPLENVLLIGITNYKEYLDSAALRAGRFDMHLHLEKPKGSKAQEILHHYLRPLCDKNKLCQTLDKDELEKAVKDMTGAEIEAFVESAKRSALGKCSIFAGSDENYRKIDLSDFSISSKSLNRSEKLQGSPTSKKSRSPRKNPEGPIRDAFNPRDVVGYTDDRGNSKYFDQSFNSHARRSNGPSAKRKQPSTNYALNQFATSAPPPLNSQKEMEIQNLFSEAQIPDRGRSLDSQQVYRLSPSSDQIITSPNSFHCRQWP